MEYNSVEAGKGEKWKEIWLSNRKTKYQPKFDAVFNKYLKEVGKSAVEGADAKYTINVRIRYSCVFKTSIYQCNN